LGATCSARPSRTPAARSSSGAVARPITNAPPAIRAISTTRHMVGTYSPLSAMPPIKDPYNETRGESLARHSRQDAVMERVAAETAQMPNAMMMSPPDEAALLTMLARLSGARRALEVGTFTGYGAIAIARG